MADDGACRRAVAIEAARRRGAEMGKHHFHGGTLHRFPPLSRIELQVRGWLLGELDLTELDRARVVACYEGAKEEHERRRQQYLAAIKTGDSDTMKAIEEERAEHNREVRARLHSPEREE